LEPVLLVAGEIHRGSKTVTLILPSVFFHYPILVHFWGIDVGPWGMNDTVMRGRGYPYTMYIYSLGHFLSTKGALIDGDGYPPKNPKNDPKMTPKSDKI